MERLGHQSDLLLRNLLPGRSIGTWRLWVRDCASKRELTGRSRRGRRNLDLLPEGRKHRALSSIWLSGLRIPQARPEPKTKTHHCSPKGQKGNQQIGAVHGVILSPQGMKSDDDCCLNQGTLARKPESTPIPKCIRRFAARRCTIEDPGASIRTRADAHRDPKPQLRRNRLE